MTHVYQLAQVADQNLSEIWNNTCERWSARQADKYLSELEACFIKFARHPDLGKQRPKIKTEYRSLPKNHHLIFYRHHQGRVEIIREKLGTVHLLIALSPLIMTTISKIYA